jgi:hypothetical protein
MEVLSKLQINLTPLGILKQTILKDHSFHSRENSYHNLLHY